ncbi:hypothetical protein B9G69_006380 [Bdellovibrio sp. SKB1291214]|uniref:hypothetical protein n=1 Tax=Bdellovibrio sp. SKB1291214 TaxID=1732569 RepID=UPI000B516601|nr:hypothetical protein [Bdellovibrio sp. SKB1291214]UYL10204.1 hypothetical protein B9G69_006380 [Bdellovibrio sp. SKB1291214]
MNKMNMKRCALAAVLSIGFLAPQMPKHALAAENAPSNFPIDLFDIGDQVTSSNNNNQKQNSNTPNNNNGGNNANSQQGNRPNNGNGNNSNGNNGQNRIGNPSGRPQSGSSPIVTQPSGGNNTNNNNNNNNGSKRPTMKVAQVGQEFSCPMFENSSSTSGIYQALSALKAEINGNSDCQKTSGNTIKSESTIIQDNMAIIEQIMKTPSGTQIDTKKLDDAVTATLGSANTIGKALNDNALLNSACGRDTMSKGGLLTSFNELINGLTPVALYAVSMNAALAPALPFVVGGAAASAGISALKTILESKSIDMDNSDQRKAFLQNTCQVVKVVNKVRYMQLTQSGRISEMTKELKKNMSLYKGSLSSQASAEMTNLINHKKESMAFIEKVRKQYTEDNQAYTILNKKISSMNDSSGGNNNLALCTYFKTRMTVIANNKLSTNMVFPATAFQNLYELGKGNIEAQIDAESFSTVNGVLEKQILGFNLEKARSNELSECANQGMNWLKNIYSALLSTQSQIAKASSDLEDSLAKSPDYQDLKDQAEKMTTISRVERAMQELTKENPVFNRSELPQNTEQIKYALFGSHASWYNSSPTMDWINHTVDAKNMALSNFNLAVEQLRKNALNLSDAKDQSIIKPIDIYGRVSAKSQKIISTETEKAKNLVQLNKSNKRLTGNRNAMEVVCKNLDTAWLQWTQALELVGSIQFLCDMVDPIVDITIGKNVVQVCRGNLDLDARYGKKPLVETIKQDLVRNGYETQALKLKSIIDELGCQETNPTY